MDVAATAVILPKAGGLDPTIPVGAGVALVVTGLALTQLRRRA
jgi:LPXTG-motif cell wall-anchored protein